MIYFLMAILFLCTPVHAQPAPEKVCFGRSCVEVEVVQTQEEKMRGLQFRETLDQDKGMLFLFPEKGYHNFWMKNTFIPLDMLWLDETRIVVYMEKDVQPCKEDPCPIYGPDFPAAYVLEVNAGYVDAHQIRFGDIAEFK